MASLESWLLAALGLFADTLAALLDVAILAFFLRAALFFALVSFVASLVRNGRKGRL